MYWTCILYTIICQLFQLYNLIKRISSRKSYTQNDQPEYFTVTREIQTFNVRSNHAFFNLIYNLFRPVHLSQTFLTEDYGYLLYYKGFHHQNVIYGLPSLSIYFLTNNAPAERLIWFISMNWRKLDIPIRTFVWTFTTFFSTHGSLWTFVYGYIL